VARGGSGACGRGGDVPLRTRGALGNRPGPLRGSAFNGWTRRVKGGVTCLDVQDSAAQIVREMQPALGSQVPGSKKSPRWSAGRRCRVPLFPPIGMPRPLPRFAFRRSASLSSARERGLPRRDLRAAMTLARSKEDVMHTPTLTTSSSRKRGPIASVLVRRTISAARGINVPNNYHRRLWVPACAGTTRESANVRTTVSFARMTTAGHDALLEHHIRQQTTFGHVAVIGKRAVFA
jgi:hypothetical protein